MTKQKSTTFIDDTMSRLDDVRPQKVWQARLKSAAIGVVIVVLCFAVSWLLSSYFYDIIYTIYFDPSDFSFQAVRLGDTLLELLLIAIILFAVLYLVYRKTDWPLVRHQFILMFTFLSLLGFGGGLLATYASSNFLEAPNTVVESFPHRQDRRERIQDVFVRNGKFAGLIVSIDVDSETVEIKNQVSTKKFGYQNLDVQRGDYIIGDVVLIDFELTENDDLPQIISIKKMPSKDVPQGRIREILKDRQPIRKRIEDSLYETKLISLSSE